MVDYKLDGVEKTLSLPDKYLTVGQWEDCLRHLVNVDLGDGKTVDFAVLREIATMLFDGVKLRDLSATPQNSKTLLKIYEHLGELLANSFQIGDEIIDEVESKKEVADLSPAETSTPPTQERSPQKNRNQRRSKTT